jgi:hypothetical protein
MPNVPEENRSRRFAILIDADNTSPAHRRRPCWSMRTRQDAASTRKSAINTSADIAKWVGDVAEVPIVLKNSPPTTGGRRSPTTSARLRLSLMQRAVRELVARRLVTTRVRSPPREDATTEARGP